MNKGFISQAIKVVAVLAVATVIAVLLITMRPKAERQVRTQKGLLVEVLPIKAENLNMMIEAYGTVKPREVLKLVAEARGQIVAMHPSFEEGGYIRKGRILVKIDPRNYQLEVERRGVQIILTEAELKRLQQEMQNLEASLEIAKSDVELAGAENSRLKKLISKNIVAQTTVDKTEQRYLSSLERLQGLENQLALKGPLGEQIEAQRAMAKVQLRQAKLDLERTSIVSPFNGWVLEKNVEKGQHVNAGQYLGKIYKEGALDIEVRIPIKDLKWFPPVSSRSSRAEAEITFGSKDTSYSWKGRVARIKAQMDEKTRTLPVVVEVNKIAAAGGEQGNFHLRPGMFVTVLIKGREIKQAFVLPRHVVHAGDVVYIVIDNRLRIRPVDILRSFKDSIFVDKGLSDGELIIKTPISGPAEGMQVRVKGS